jgi:hypothetical protein
MPGDGDGAGAQGPKRRRPLEPLRLQEGGLGHADAPRDPDERKAKLCAHHHTGNTEND